MGELMQALMEVIVGSNELGYMQATKVADYYIHVRSMTLVFRSRFTIRGVGYPLLLHRVIPKSEKGKRGPHSFAAGVFCFFLKEKSDWPDNKICRRVASSIIVNEIVFGAGF